MVSQTADAVARRDAPQISRPRRLRTLKLLKEVFKHALLLIVLIVCIMPFLWIVGIALKTKKEFYQTPFSLPADPQWDNFATAWTVGHFSEFFPNSLILSVSVVLGVIVCSVLAGYAFARIDFHGREVLFYAFLVGMMIPFQAVMIPLYYELRDLMLLKTYFGGIMPLVAQGIPFGIFLMRAFFLGLSQELVDAAKIDGCDDLGVLFHVLLPLAQPALATLVVIQFMNAWNAFLIPLLFMQAQRLRPLTLGLLYYRTRYEADYTMIAAGVTITILPMILIYTLFQNQIEEGLTAGALKG